MCANALIVPETLEEAATSRLADDNLFYESLLLSAITRTPMNPRVLTTWLVVEKWNVR